jgi:DNA polymerase V
VGRGYAKKLESHGMFTMGDVALTSLCNEDLLYRLFGINAELLIDHAWGFECCKISDIKAYKPQSKSLNSGQVLTVPYSTKSAEIIVREMCDSLVLDMVSKNLSTNQIVLTIGYDVECLSSPGILYTGEITYDHYGRAVPKSAHGTINLDSHSSSTKEIIDATLKLYHRIINTSLLVRRINISANNLISENERVKAGEAEQLDFFTDYSKREAEKQEKEAYYSKEKEKQRAVISIRNKFGKNSILKGTSFEDGATAADRNTQIGGHKA